jgi:hypothetical protein
MTDAPISEQPEDTSGRIEALVQRTQKAVLAGVEEILQRQMVPFLDQARRAVLAGTEEVLGKHADALLVRLKGITLETAEELLQRQLEPFLERTRAMVLDGLENAAFVQKYTDRLVAGLKQFLAETAAEVVRVHVPDYSRRVGRRLIDYAVAGTLSCLAVGLLGLGGVLGLQAAGLPTYAACLVVSGFAALAAFVLLRLRSRGLAGASPSPASRPEE